MTIKQKERVEKIIVSQIEQVKKEITSTCDARAIAIAALVNSLIKLNNLR